MNKRQDRLLVMIEKVHEAVDESHFFVNDMSQRERELWDELVVNNLLDATVNMTKLYEASREREENDDG